MPNRSYSTSRIAAVVVAVAALIGDALLLRDTLAREQAGLLHGLWTDAMFFSDLSNLLLAVVFALVALAVLHGRRPWWLGLAIVCIGLTFLGANGWRGFTRPLSGNTLVHTWAPTLAALWCLLFASKGRLRWTNLLTWTLVPLGYIAYATVRGLATGHWPYPWLDPSRVGWSGVTQGILIQLVIFAVMAALLVLADKLWSRIACRQQTS